MFISEALLFGPEPQVRSTQPAPHIVVGITSSQTCLTLTGRLRALRLAGFRVTLVSSPGELLDRTAAREGVESVAIPMKREIAPPADIVSLVRLWWLLLRLRPDMTEFSTPKAGLLGTLAAMLAGVPTRIYMLRGLKVEGTAGFKRRILLAAERLAAFCAQIVLCNSQSMRAEALAMGLAPAAKLNLLGDGSSNGVDVERFSPGSSGVRGRLGLPSEAPVVGFVGRLTCDKGLPELMDAFDTILKSEPEAHLLLVGWFDAAARTDRESSPHSLHRLCGRCSAILSRDGPDGSAHLAGGFSQRRAGGRGKLRSGDYNHRHGFAGLRSAGGDRPADSSRLP